MHDLEANMATTKSVSSNYADSGSGIASAIAAIRTLRQKFEHDIEELTASRDVLARAEGLIADHQTRASGTSGPRGNKSDTATVDRTVGSCDSGFPTGVRKAICGLTESLPARFTAPEVLSKLEAQGFKFARAPKAAVRDALYVLSRGTERRFRIAEVGTGGKPNVYESIFK